LGKKVILKTT